MSGQAHKDIYLANIDKLAEKIIRKKIPVFHFRIPCDFGESPAFDIGSSFAFARLVAAETSRTDKAPALADKAARRREERDYCRTSRSGHFPCNAANPVRQLVRHSKDC